MNTPFKIGIIGSTGKGGYGHGLDTAFSQSERAQIVAVADDDPEGLTAKADELCIARRYPDYRKMLSSESLNIVCIGPRWVTERVEMVTACAEAGCHIYCEKPLAGTLMEIDEICRAVNNAGVKMALAHQFHGAATITETIKDVEDGVYGRLLRMYGRPKDDARGGGEELMVHGCHLFNLMVAFAGEPRWVNAHISANGRDATVSDSTEGAEPVGPIAGDSIAAAFGFDNDVRGFFDSKANMAPSTGSLYGLRLECENAMLHIRTRAEVFIYPAPSVMPEYSDMRWERLIVPEWHHDAAGQPRDLKHWLHLGNHALAEDLMDAIERDSKPVTSLNRAASVMEMIQGVYASHFSARRLVIPLEEREHPMGSVRQANGTAVTRSLVSPILPGPV